MDYLLQSCVHGLQKVKWHVQTYKYYYFIMWHEGKIFAFIELPRRSEMSSNEILKTFIRQPMLQLSLYIPCWRYEISKIWAVERQDNIYRIIHSVIGGSVELQIYYNNRLYTFPWITWCVGQRLRRQKWSWTLRWCLRVHLNPENENGCYTAKSQSEC
jgi:hypothetical protein